MTISLITTTVSPMPTGPQRMGAVDPATFIAASDAWNTHLEGSTQPEMAAVVAQINAVVEGINDAVESVESAAAATADDAMATAADRVQTGLDRSAIAGAAAATADDAVATAADRVQTGIDRAAVEVAMAQIADGPVVSVNGLSGVVTLAAADVGAQETLESGENIKTFNGQTLLGSGDIALPDANSFSFAAGGPIAAGKPLLLQPDGSVVQSEIADATYGTPTMISGVNAKCVSVCYHPPTGKFVVFYSDTSDGNKGKAAVVASFSGNSITGMGSPVTFSDAALHTSESGIDSCYDEDTGQIVVAWASASDNYGRLCTCSVSGSSCTFGAVLDTGALAYNLGVCYDTSVNRVLYTYRASSVQYAKVIFVAGTALSVVSSGTVFASSVSGYTSAVVHCKGHSVAGTNAVCFNIGTVFYVFAVVINPITYAITVGDAYTASGGYVSGGKTIVWAEDIQRLAVLGSRGGSYSNVLALWRLSLSGSTFSYETLILVDSSNFNTPYQNFSCIDYSPLTGTFCVVYSDHGSSYYGKALFISKNFTFTTAEYQFKTANVGWTAAAFSASGDRLLVAFSITSSYGEVVSFSPPKLDRRTAFVGFSTQAADAGDPVGVTTTMGVNSLQSGLTPGAIYYLSSTDGYTLTTVANGPRVGKALSANDLLVLGSNIYQV